MDDITKIKSCLLYDIDCFKSRGYELYNINQMTVNSTSDRFNVTYEQYFNNPMHMVARRLNMISAKNP